MKSLHIRIINRDACERHRFFLYKFQLTTTHMHIRVDTEDRWAADVIGQRAAETLSDSYHHRFIEGKVITKPSCWAGDGKEEKTEIGTT